MERKDSWSIEDDHILAEVVLEHVRNGSTQIKGFEEAANRLNRTAPACGFRWNSVVRQRYADELQSLKQTIKVRKVKVHGKLQAAHTAQEMSGRAEAKKPIQQVIDYINDLEQTVTRQKQEIEQLRDQLNHQSTNSLKSEDLDTLMQIISHARQRGVLDQAN